MGFAQEIRVWCAPIPLTPIISHDIPCKSKVATNLIRPFGRRRRGIGRGIVRVSLWRTGGGNAFMGGFVSNHTNKIDGKGRVSVPAGFRTVLARDGYEGLYCYPSLDMNAVDAGGNSLFRAIEQRLADIETYTPNHDYLSTAFYGMGEQLKIDQDGRISLTDSLKGYAGIDSHVTFVGQGYKFQIWDPDRFKEHSRKAMEMARRMLRSEEGAGGTP